MGAEPPGYIIAFCGVLAAWERLFWQPCLRSQYLIPGSRDDGYEVGGSWASTSPPQNFPHACGQSPIPISSRIHCLPGRLSFRSRERHAGRLTGYDVRTGVAKTRIMEISVAARQSQLSIFGRLFLSLSGFHRSNMKYLIWLTTPHPEKRKLVLLLSFLILVPDPGIRTPVPVASRSSPSGEQV